MSAELRGTLSKSKRRRFEAGVRRTGVDARDKPGHDGWRAGFAEAIVRQTIIFALLRPR
jgi:hypothetical protein